MDLSQPLLVGPFLGSVGFNEGELVALRLLLLGEQDLALSFFEFLLASQLRGLDLLADLISGRLTMRGRCAGGRGSDGAGGCGRTRELDRFRDGTE